MLFDLQQVMCKQHSATCHLLISIKTINMCMCHIYELQAILKDASFLQIHCARSSYALIMSILNDFVFLLSNIYYSLTVGWFKLVDFEFYNNYLKVLRHIEIGNGAPLDYNMLGSLKFSALPTIRAWFNNTNNLCGTGTASVSVVILPRFSSLLWLPLLPRGQTWHRPIRWGRYI